MKKIALSLTILSFLVNSTAYAQSSPAPDYETFAFQSSEIFRAVPADTHGYTMAAFIAKIAKMNGLEGQSGTEVLNGMIQAQLVSSDEETKTKELLAQVASGDIDPNTLTVQQFYGKSLSGTQVAGNGPLILLVIGLIIYLGREADQQSADIISLEQKKKLAAMRERAQDWQESQELFDAKNRKFNQRYAAEKARSCDIISSGNTFSADFIESFCGSLADDSSIEGAETGQPDLP